MVALVGWSRIAGGHTWRLRVRGMHHSGGSGGGHNGCKENPSQDTPVPQVLRLACPSSHQLGQSRALVSYPCLSRDLDLHTRGLPVG